MADKPVGCPNCKTKNIRRRGSYIYLSIGIASITVGIIFLSTLVAPFILLPFGIYFLIHGLKGRKWRCKECSHIWTEAKSGIDYGDRA